MFTKNSVLFCNHPGLTKYHSDRCKGSIRHGDLLLENGEVNRVVLNC